MHALVNWLFGTGLEPGLATVLFLLADALALATVPSVLLRRRGWPAAAVSWILALFALPFLGVGAWWLIGREHLERRRRKRQAASQAFCAWESRTARAAHERALSAFEGVLPWAAMARWAPESALPPTAGNRVAVLSDGGEAFPAMEEAIQAARRNVHALFYIWKDDGTGRRMRDLLIERARGGVEVRVLLDAVGSWGIHRSIARPLRQAGARVDSFLPPRFVPWAPTFNFRNHRKILLVDDRVGFVGGMNVGEEYERGLHDLAVRIEGPAVEQLQEVFLEDWFFATGENLSEARLRRGPGLAPLQAQEPTGEPQASCAVLASGPDEDEYWMHDAFFLAISGARERVYLTTPYFVPSPAITAALRGAAERGVRVVLLVPRYNDVSLVGLASRSYYASLLRAGVQIFEYRKRLHQKSLVVDRRLSVVGSANVDIRSFCLNFEVGCFIDSEGVNARLAALFEEDLERSVQVEWAQLERVPWYRALPESMAHLLSPVL